MLATHKSSMQLSWERIIPRVNVMTVQLLSFFQILNKTNVLPHKNECYVPWYKGCILCPESVMDAMQAWKVVCWLLQVEVRLVKKVGFDNQHHMRFLLYTLINILDDTDLQTLFSFSDGTLKLLFNLHSICIELSKIKIILLCEFQIDFNTMFMMLLISNLINLHNNFSALYVLCS